MAKETTGRTFYEKVIEVQNVLKAPKGQYNTFSNYKYRSAEDILQAAKPLLNERGLFMILTDTIELIGARYYVKAIATITDGVTSIETSAYAREEDQKKGMDASQITGAASSYARKYALNGLFCIDDARDSDTTNNGPSSNEKKKELTTSQQLDFKEKYNEAVEDLQLSTTFKEYEAAWGRHPEFQSNKDFRAVAVSVANKVKGK